MAFYNNLELKSIVIPENIELIKSLAFTGCESLETVIILSPKIMLEKESFLGCTK